METKKLIHKNNFELAKELAGEQAAYFTIHEINFVNFMISKKHPNCTRTERKYNKRLLEIMENVEGRKNK